MVLVINLCNGERFNTYAMKGKTGECWVLGGAARLSEIGDKLLIISYGFMETKEATHYTPKIITLDEKNQIIK
jgi:aspartate 1-decarboxylase